MACDQCGLQGKIWEWLPLAGEKAIRYRPARPAFSNG